MCDNNVPLRSITPFPGQLRFYDNTFLFSPSVFRRTTCLHFVFVFPFIEWVRCGMVPTNRTPSSSVGNNHSLVFLGHYDAKPKMTRTSGSLSAMHRRYRKHVQRSQILCSWNGPWHGWHSHFFLSTLFSSDCSCGHRLHFFCLALVFRLEPTCHGDGGEDITWVR